MAIKENISYRRNREINAEKKITPVRFKKNTSITKTFEVPLAVAC